MEISATRNYNPQGLNTTFESEKQTDQLKDKKFSIRKELYKGIKENDVAKIVNRSTDRQTEEDFKYDQYTDVHNVLTQKRRNFDDHKTATNNKKKQIQALKKQIQELTFIQDSLKQSITGSKNQLKSVSNQLQDTKLECQYSVFRKDVYQNILQRTKAIYLVQKKRLFDIEFELQKVRNQHRSIVLDALNKKKLEQQCRKMLSSIEKVVDVQKRSRSQRLSSIQDVLVKKREAIKKRSERDREISFLVQQASNQKSYQQKQWSKLLYTNKLLHCILKNKISRQLLSHQKIQKTFQKIKLNTGVNQAQQFVEKYLMREQTYGQLLNSISQKQPLLQKQQFLNQKLNTQLRQMSEQQSIENNMGKKMIPENTQTKQKQKQLQQLSKKMILFQRQKEAFYQWTIKFIKKHDILTSDSTKNKLNYYEAYPRTQLQTLYKKVESLIFDNINQATNNPETVQQKLLENRLDTGLESQMLLRNMRVRTEGNQIQDFNQEDDGQEYNQLEYLHEHRKSIKRDVKNRKFRIKTKAH